ncbi:MAG: hypothetical protein ACRDFS_12050, partial [Chloroflexota bacterium]
TWTQGGSPSGHAELFPGTYTSFPNGHGSNGAPNFTLNPGVYTFTGTIDMTGGSYCIFGSPSCDGGTFCSSDTFANGSAAANQWYYKCSPWGYWDGSTSIDGVARPGTLPTAAPTWYDISNDSSTSIPLNGVTLYFPNGSGGMVSGGLQMKGNSVANYLAAPNPCPGTGSSYSAGSSVEFPAGVASATYSYLSGTQPYIEGTTASPMTSTSPAWSEVYPNADLSLLGECQNTLNVWPGEMPVPQHLHFIFYQQGIGNKVRGTSNQNFWGIFYDPGGQLQILGNTGSSSAAGGPPWMSGQIIVGSTDWSGNTTISVFYRPCAAGSTACGSGRGEQLVQ